MVSHHARPGRILVAVDDAGMCDYLRGLLAEQYDVIAASDGEAAFEAACEQQPDLVLSGVMMPRLDGYGLVKRLRAQPQTSALPIILLLARAGEETCVEALEDGADDCLIDPFGARELLARVHTHLRLGKARRALEGELRQTNLTRMQELSGKQIGEGGLQPLLQEIMNTAVAGVRSMQSTPLITRGGRLLGILTTHWSVPHAPGEHELWRLDLLVRQITDLMESAEAEEALRKSEQRLATTLSHLPIGVGIVDTAGSVIDANPAWNRLLRRDGPSIEVSDRWPFPPAANPVLRALRGEEVLPGIEFLRMGEDGIERWTRAGGVPIRDETGQITGALAMVQDIDEERWAEAQRAELLAKEAALKTEKALRGADAQLARVVRALSVGELATSIAHEINQPLAGVVTNAAAGLRWLRGEPPNVEEARESLALVARDGNRASAIIRRIRDSLRKGTQVTTWFDLNEMIQETVVLAHANLEKERCVIQIELSDDIQRVRGDRIQLQQVILNLLLNGAEAMAGVEGARELRVQTRRTDTGVVVAIRDRGPGINPENLTRLFDAFFTTKPDGIGIGLSISQTIVEAHGGRIWADVKDGPGLTVQFELPAESANASRD